MSNKITTAIQRPLNAALAVLMLAAVSAPAVLMGTVSAAGQASTRSILMSDSSNGTTGVSYKLTFTPATAAQELVIDFCSDTPFSGATCAFTAGTVPTVPATPTSSAGTAASVGSGTPVHTLKVTGLTMTGGSSYNITVGGLTNPGNTNTTFYARVYTYTTGTAANFVPANTSGGSTTVGAGNVDFGGIALSTTSAINITARVMESLSFCVYSSSCGVPVNVTIGGGANNTLDTNPATAAANFSLSTNAATGASVTLNGDTLRSGGNSIPAAGAAAVAIGIGANKFGVRVSTPGGLTATSPYNTANYALDINTTTGTMSTFGQQVASVGAPVSASISTLTYSAAAGTTTPAGIYTTSHVLVATGTF